MPCTKKYTSPDGRVYYRIFVSRGRGKSRLSKTWEPPKGWSEKSIRRELAAAAAEFERECDAGEVISRAEEKERQRQAAEAQEAIPTVKYYVRNVFMPAKETTMSRNAVACYNGNIDNKIIPAIGNMKMPDVTPAQLDQILLQEQRKGRARGTVLKLYTVLLGIFKMAYRQEVISKNPMDRVDRPKPRKDEVLKTETDAFTVEEIKQFLSVLDGEPLKWKCLSRVILETGVRRGECVGLQWNDIDLQSGVVSISRTVNYTPADGVYTDTLKNRKTKTVYLGEKTLALLNEYKAECSGSKKSDYVFTQEGTHEPMNPQSPTRYFKKLGTRCGLLDLHPHKLRHTFASLAITNGADIASVSEALGHSDKAVTLRMYTHANEENISRAASLFRSVIEG